jgi:energy-coupling factor transporter ATP-binding protein EcfA2
VKLELLQVPDYKSIESIDLHVAPLTVLFGKNNCGKTNLLEAISQLFVSASDPAGRGGVQDARPEGRGGYWIKLDSSDEAEDPVFGAVCVELIREWLTEISPDLLELEVPDVELDDLLDPSWGWTWSELRDEAAVRLFFGANADTVRSSADQAEAPERLERIRQAHLLLDRALLRLERERMVAVLGFPGEALDPEVVGALVELCPSVWASYERELESGGPNDPFVKIATVPIDWRPRVLWVDWEVRDLTAEVQNFLAELLASFDKAPPRGHGLSEFPPPHRDRGWLVFTGGDGGTYEINPKLVGWLSTLAELANQLLPDFVNGRIESHITAAHLWDVRRRVSIKFEEVGADQCSDQIESAGMGVSRWAAAALRVAMELVRRQPGLADGERMPADPLAGYFVFLDEPEAHLHHAAVSSVVQWCRRIISLGANVFVATHHEEFLRRVNGSDALLELTKPVSPASSTITSISPDSVSALQELAVRVGVHPASVLSLRRAVLFVEGVLDVAVLDELYGRDLDRAGVLLVAMAGTRNLQGIPVAILQSQMGLKFGILTDDTEPETMGARSNKQRSSEEKKVLKVVEICEQAGLERPMVFGVPERDLLHALPEDGIRCFIEEQGLLASSFPGWGSLEAEARAEMNVPGHESVHWKEHARVTYGLPLTDEAGVRSLVRWLDLAGYSSPSVSRVMEEIVAWVELREPAVVEGPQ